MNCPFCSEDDTRVIDSRLVGGGAQVRRRRECSSCKERITTYETAELLMPKIIKRDGTRAPFDEGKLRLSMTRALEKRPVSVEQVEAIRSEIMRDLRSCGEREIESKLVGEAVMDALKEIDQVAYVRFASVYRSFQDVNAFREEIDRLEDHVEET